jgi:deoxyribodipyrimidine photo-lyase
MSYILFLFHRDFRLADHKGLEFVERDLLPRFPDADVIPAFFFTPEQVTPKNKYRSLNSIQFMIQSLMELNQDLRKQKTRLFCFFGSNLDMVDHLHRISSNGLKAVVEVKDYTPFAKQRETDFRKWCMVHGVEYHCPEDIYITNPGTVLTGSKKTFQKFTPFYEAAQKKAVDKPTDTIRLPWIYHPSPMPKETHLTAMRKKLIPMENRNLHVKGGRKEGLWLCEHLPPKYDSERDVPAKQTSNLSAHNHYGTVSIREVYWAGRKFGLQEFVRQLYWRDFYGHIMDSFETLYDQDAFAFMHDPGVGWKTDTAAFQRWTQGRTGHELVDAGMRQLNETGYMHNRVRLVCSSYLAKDLKIHWRWGERYFAQKLVDYDVTQNMMNWIWVSSVLPFASAPFRRIDPERTAEQLDALKQYRSTWLEKGRGNESSPSESRT